MGGGEAPASTWGAGSGQGVGGETHPTSWGAARLLGVPPRGPRGPHTPALGGGETKSSLRTFLNAQTGY